MLITNDLNKFKILLHGKDLILSQTTNFRLNLKAFAFDNFEFKKKKWPLVLHKGREHCGEWRNCSLQVISPFPTVFSKELHWRYIKIRAFVIKTEYLQSDLKTSTQHQ